MERWGGVRRSSGTFAAMVRIGPLTVNVSGRSVLHGEGSVELPRAELKLLLYLAEHHDRAVSIEELRDEALRAPHSGLRTVYSHVCTLRKRLARLGQGTLIKTLHGDGYRLALPLKAAGA